MVGYLDVGVIAGYVTELPLAARYLKSGQAALGFALIVAAILATAAAIPITYGSVRRRSWAFWLSVALLGLGLPVAFRQGIPTALPSFIWAWLDALLFIACLVSYLVIGPWAQRSGSTTNGVPQAKA